MKKVLFLWKKDNLLTLFCLFPKKKKKKSNKILIMKTNSPIIETSLLNKFKNPLKKGQLIEKFLN